MSLYPISICALSSCLTVAPSSPAELTNNQIKHQRPTRAVTTNWAESSEVTCAPPLMVGPLQRNALHAHCTPLSPSICDKQNYICSPFSRCTKLKRALFVKFLSLKSNTQVDGNSESNSFLWKYQELNSFGYSCLLHCCALYVIHMGRFPPDEALL